MRQPTRLYDKLLRLRMAAIALYEHGIRSGVKPEEIQKHIAPLTDTMHKVIAGAVKDDIASVALAVFRLESEVVMHETDIELLKQKAKDAKFHIQLLKTAVAGRAEELGVTELEGRGYIAAVTKTDQGEVVSFR